MTVEARDFALQTFIDAARQALTKRLPPEQPAGLVLRRIFAALEQAGSMGNRQPQRLPVCQHLDAALMTARSAKGDVGMLADAFQAIEPRLNWARRPGAEKAGEVFAKGHANTMIVGPGGLEPREDVWIGASLMAPEIQYIDHHHPPAEVYLALSPGTWRQGDQPWHEPGIGGTVFNTPNIVHAMKSGEAPLFAIWCLLVQDN